MRVFVTGATGFIGSHLVKDLIAHGHQVLGLSRSPEKSEALAATGAEVLQGSIEDLDLLSQAAAQADGVIHLAFNHDFSRFLANCEDDRRVITTLGTALAGSHRPLVITSGTAIAQNPPGAPATESSPAHDSSVNPRAASEEAAAAFAAQGVNVSIVRLPQVHDTRRQGLVPYATAAYIEKQVCAYIGNGENRWPAGHISDVAPLYRLALEKSAPHAIYHAVGEEGITMRAIAETLSQRLNLPLKSIPPDEAADFFGWLSRFAIHDMPASSAQTQSALNWHPTGRGLLADLAELEL